MNMEYLFYFYQLPEEEKKKQLLIIIAFFAILFIIATILEFLKYKYKDKTSNKLFQKILEKV